MEVAPLFGPLEKADAGLSSLARGVIGSEILKIAAEVRALKAKGVDDLQPHGRRLRPGPLSRSPRALGGDARRRSSRARRTTRPPTACCRSARPSSASTRASWGSTIPSSRSSSPRAPGRSSTPRTGRSSTPATSPSTRSRRGTTTTTPGSRAPAPSRSRSTRPSNFFPTPAQLAPHLHVARLLVDQLAAQPDGDRHRARRAAPRSRRSSWRRTGAATPTGRRPLFLVYDQVYWMLTFHGAVHVTPVGLVPEVAPYTILLDAISKSFCATGLRVGWGVMPPADARADGRHPRARRRLGAARRAGGDREAPRRVRSVTGRGRRR